MTSAPVRRSSPSVNGSAASFNPFAWVSMSDPETIATTNSLIALAIAAVTLIYLVPSRHLLLRRARFRLDASRRERLFTLLKDHKWKSVSAVELELGFADAFGFGLGADVIRHVFARKNAVEHITYLKRCRLMVRVRDDAKGLERTERAVRNFRLWSGVWMVLGIAPYLIAFIAFHIIGDAGSKGLFVCIIALAYFWLLIAGWVSLGLDAAYQVTERGEKRFPLDGGPSPAGEGTRRTRSTRQTGATTDALDATPGAESAEISGQRSAPAATSADPASNRPIVSAIQRRSRSLGVMKP